MAKKTGAKKAVKHTAKKAGLPTAIASVVSGFPMIKNVGLRQVHVADTLICNIDGNHGKLIYRGYSIETLAEYSTFEETAYLLLYGNLPTREELAAFTSAMKSERTLPPDVLKSLIRMPRGTMPMDVLQAITSTLAGHDPEIANTTREASVRKAIRLLSKMSTVVAAWSRTREGEEPIPPRDDLSHAANFLFMLTGREPDPEHARVFDVNLILQAEHQFNASTFTCRVVASTRAHLYAAVAAGIGALSGALHGGASNEVIKMLREIGSADRAEEYVRTKLSSGDRVMGMGHAVYKTHDPRALILRDMAIRLAGRPGGDRRWFDLSQAVEKSASDEFRKMGKHGIYPNVDFFTAVVNTALGIAPDLHTPVFTMSRISGWCAHIIEERFAEAQPKPAIYRPLAHYIGPGSTMKSLPYVSIDKRRKAKEA